MTSASIADRAALAAAAPVRLGRAVALGGVAVLVLLGLAWELWLAPTGRGTLAIKVLPLLFVLPGLARHRLSTYRGLSLLVWLYVFEGSFRAGFQQGAAQWLAVLQTVLAIALFAVCAVYIRHRLRTGKALAQAND